MIRHNFRASHGYSKFHFGARSVWLVNRNMLFLYILAASLQVIAHQYQLIFRSTTDCSDLHCMSVTPCCLPLLKEHCQHPVSTRVYYFVHCCQRVPMGSGHDSTALHPCCVQAVARAQLYSLVCLCRLEFCFAGELDSQGKSLCFCLTPNELKLDEMQHQAAPVHRQCFAPLVQFKYYNRACEAVAVKLCTTMQPDGHSNRSSP